MKSRLESTAVGMPCQLTRLAPRHVAKTSTVGRMSRRRNPPEETCAQAGIVGNRDAHAAEGASLFRPTLILLGKSETV